MRRIVPVGLLVALATGMLPLAFSQLSDEEKREMFLRAREDMRAVPRATSTPKPRPSPARRATPPPAPASTPQRRQETPEPPPRSTPEPEPPQDSDADEGVEERPPRERPASTPKPRSTPEPTSRPSPTPKPTPTPKPKPTPKPTPTPKPKPTPREKAKEEKPDAPIVVEKSGKAEDEGFVPPPKEKKRGFLFFGGGGPKYTYLTPAVRAAIDDAKVRKGRWKYIIVHNSGTRQGNAKAFDTYHKKVRKMQNGLAYHFVIGNGTSSGNGEIEIGNRWVRQINGGHVASDYLNNIAIGICFVGDFNRDVPTKAQAAALQELIDYLRRRCGKSGGKEIIVRGHRQINPKPTDCPGNRFPLKWLNSTFKD